MIIQISDICPDETIETRVKDGTIVTRPVEQVDIRIEKARKGYSSTTPQHTCVW